MRLIVMLLTLACMPAICQENADSKPDNPSPGFSAGVPQKLSDALRLKLGYNFVLQTPQKASASILRMMTAKPEISTCSIPLLNVKPPGTPVAMPNMMPKQSNQVFQAPGPIDNMKVVVPAPACPADFGRVSATPTKP